VRKTLVMIKTLVWSFRQPAFNPENEVSAFHIESARLRAPGSPRYTCIRVITRTARFEPLSSGFSNRKLTQGRLPRLASWVHRSRHPEAAYSIAASARTRSESGTVKPSAFAVFRLMISSTLSPAGPAGPLASRLSESGRCTGRASDTRRPCGLHNSADRHSRQTQARYKSPECDNGLLEPLIDQMRM
jgi:hypothetical protein